MARENISQLTVRENLVDAQVGQVLTNKGAIEANAAYDSGDQGQVSTVTVDTASDDTEYSIVVEENEITYTSGSGATANSIATGLADAAESNIVVRGQVEPSVNGSDQLVLSALSDDGEFDVSTDDANLSVATTTSASKEDDVPVGRAVWYDGDLGTVYTDAAALGVSNANFRQYFAGVTRHTYDTESREPYSTDDAPFKPSEQVIFLRRGRIFVDGGDDASYGETVYVDETTGEFFTSDAVDRIEAPADLLMWVGPNQLETRAGF